MWVVYFAYITWWKKQDGIVSMTPDLVAGRTTCTNIWLHIWIDPNEWLWCNQTNYIHSWVYTVCIYICVYTHIDVFRNMYTYLHMHTHYILNINALQWLLACIICEMQEPDWISTYVHHRTPNFYGPNYDVRHVSFQPFCLFQPLLFHINLSTLAVWQVGDVVSHLDMQDVTCELRIIEARIPAASTVLVGNYFSDGHPSALQSHGVSVSVHIPPLRNEGYWHFSDIFPPLITASGFVHIFAWDGIVFVYSFCP